MKKIPVDVCFLKQVWNGWEWRRQATSVPRVFGLAELKFFLENPYAVPDILKNPPNTPGHLAETFRRQGRSSSELSFGFYGNIHGINKNLFREFYILTRDSSKDMGFPTNTGNGWYCGRVYFSDQNNPVFYPALAYPEGTKETLPRIKWSRFSVVQHQDAVCEDKEKRRRIADYESEYRYRDFMMRKAGF